MGKGNILRVYANENICFVFGPDTPTTIQNNPSENLAFMGLAIKKIYFLSIPNLVLCPEVGSLSCTYTQDVSLFLFHPSVHPVFRRS
jgi:hypothetical protein